MDNNSSDKSHNRPPLSLPFYYGWFVISLCFLTTLTSAGVRSSPSVLIHPLEAEFGWSRALIASAISMNLLLFGVASPISGWLIVGSLPNEDSPWESWEALTPRGRSYFCRCSWP